MRGLLIRMRVVVSVGVLLLSGKVFADTPLTLSEAYKLAINQSETLKINEEGIRAAEARYDEAISALYPNLHLLVTERLRDGAGNNGSSTSNDSGNSQFTGNRLDRFQGTLTVTQPIFSGFRDVLLADAAKLDIGSKRYDNERSHETLYLEVAELFYQSLLYGKDIKELGGAEKALRERIGELDEFVRLGKSRDGEKFAAEADIADTLAAKANTEGLLAASKEMLSYLTGVPSSELKLVSEEVPLKIEPVDYYISRGTDRADIRSIMQRIDSSKKQVTASERESWPVVSLEGNYYPYESPDTSRDADVLFKFDVPIFEGGRIEARTEQQRANQRILELTAEQLRRKIEEDIRVAYANLTASGKERERLSDLVTSTRKNYESQKRDYALGVVTNIDVLLSLRQLQDSKRRLIRAEADERVNRAKLLVAAGGDLS